ncbi:DUF1732 domain-containing protein [Aequorivita sp. SDUM287046]|uniref:DUF1732 domain-containing protein n=1 Tax=Aequorivita aurantiaca TaxID=3053356 RepID=A0ABT8DLT9_9FLAO|nr:DUF1732 domain-containing protein [Aequorivita aurantiaca]MDN3724941.1 DUF1732 domain-containing protein [Aequorivita aurantiaca]
MKLKLSIILALIVGTFFTSCEYGRKAEEELNRLNSHAEELDAMLNENLEKITELDSILPETQRSLKKADSIVKDASSTLDSLNKKVEGIQNLFN